MSNLSKAKALLTRVGTDTCTDIIRLLEVMNSQGIPHALKFLAQCDQSNLLITTSQSLLKQESIGSATGSQISNVTRLLACLDKSTICKDVKTLLEVCGERCIDDSLRYLKQCNQLGVILTVVEDLLEKEKNRTIKQQYNVSDITRLLSKVTGPDSKRCADARLILETRNEKGFDTALKLLNLCSDHMFIQISKRVIEEKRKNRSTVGQNGSTVGQNDSAEKLSSNAITLLSNITGKSSATCQQAKTILEVCGISMIADVLKKLKECDRDDLLLVNALELLEEAQKAPVSVQKPVYVPPSTSNNYSNYSRRTNDHDYDDDDNYAAQHAYANSDHDYA